MLRGAAPAAACLLGALLFVVAPALRSGAEASPPVPAALQQAAPEKTTGTRTADRPPRTKYWIFLAERPAASTGTAGAAPADGGLPARTVRRRADRGAGEAAARALTRPVSPAHRARLRDRNIRPLVVSRWLNAVSAVLSPSQKQVLAAEPWVDDIRRIGRAAPATARADRSDRNNQSDIALRDEAALPDGRSQHPMIADLGRRSAPPRQQPTVPSDADSSFFGASYTQLQVMNALAPLRRGLDGSGVRLGFLDTGYRGLRHPAFDALRQEGRIRGVRDFTEGPQTNNHGGGVVSAAAGYAPGILVGPAHGAEIYAAATEYTPSETNVEEDYFVAGLEWMERQGVDVVNVSLGYTTFDAGERSYTTDDLDGDTGVTTRAVDAAARLGMTVVVSAGNSGCNSPENCWYYVSTPADADSAVAVGAALPDSSVAPFSSRGPTADGRTKPDVLALGSGVVAAWDSSSYAQVNGTSFASPLVSGVVAQMLQQNPRLGPVAVRRILRQTATRSSSPANDHGWGLIDAEAAVRAAERRARSEPPSALKVSPPRPIPASDRVSFSLRAPKQTDSVRIELYDLLGRRVRSVSMPLQPGPNTLRLDLRNLAPGVYPYRLRSGPRVETGKVVVVR